MDTNNQDLCQTPIDIVVGILYCEKKIGHEGWHKGTGPVGPHGVVLSAYYQNEREVKKLPADQCRSWNKLNCGCCSDIQGIRCEKPTGHEDEWHEGSEKAGEETDWEYDLQCRWKDSSNGHPHS